MKTMQTKKRLIHGVSIVLLLIGIVALIFFVLIPLFFSKPFSGILDHDFGVVEVDEYTRDYYVRIPEWMINEMNWYDGTEINIKVDGDDIIINERE